MATQGFELPKFDMTTMPMMPLMKPVDPEAVMAAHRRNVEAMTNAGQILADGARSFTQRQSEIVQARMSEFSSKAETYMKPQQPGQMNVQGQVEDAKSTYEQAVTDARELMEIVAKAQADALHVINQCMLANLEAMKKFTG
jgi:phasin family protein